MQFSSPSTATKEPPKPFFPLKHEFVASLERFIEEAGMLASTVETILNLGCIQEQVADKVRERIAAFNLAKYGDNQ